MSDELHLPVLLLNKVDFQSTISIHDKRWQCIDITPVTRMPVGILVVRITYRNNFNFRIYVYKSYNLATNQQRHEIKAINALADFEFYRLTSSGATRCPVNFVMPYQELLEDKDLREVLDASEQTENYYKINHINDRVTLFLPRVSIDAIKRIGRSSVRDISTLGGLISNGKGLEQLDSMLGEYNGAYAEWKKGVSVVDVG